MYLAKNWGNSHDNKVCHMSNIIYSSWYSNKTYDPHIGFFLCIKKLIRTSPRCTVQSDWILLNHHFSNPFSLISSSLSSTANLIFHEYANINMFNIYCFHEGSVTSLLGTKFTYRKKWIEKIIKFVSKKAWRQMIIYFDSSPAFFAKRNR